MSQKDFDNNNYLNEFNDNFDNIFIDKTINTAEFDKSLFDNNKENYKNIEQTPNSPKSKSSFQINNKISFDDSKNANYKKNNIFINNNTKQNLIKNNKRKFFSNSNNNIRNSTTPNRSFLTKSKLSINSKNNSYYKSTHSNIRKSNYISINSNISNNKRINNLTKKEQNKEIYIINKLTQEVEHIRNYCSELQRQFDNHCLIKNEKKEFENIKKENIKLTAEVSILKDDVAELMKKFGIISNKIDSMQQENNNLKMQNKNLLNFISIMSNSNSVSGLKKLKNFNFENTSLINNNQEFNTKNNNNNESMNIINLINNKNSMGNNINIEEIRNNIELENNNNINLNQKQSLKFMENNNNNNNFNINNILNNIDKQNYNLKNINNNNFNINNLNSDLIEFSISKSMSKNFEKPQMNKQNYFKTINDNESRFDYTNANTNSNTNINIQSKTQSDFHTLEQKNINTGNNATDIASLIQSNFNITNQFRNSSNSKNKQNRFLIPKNED